MSTTAADDNARRDVQHHPLIVRLTHWATAFAVVIMIGSGWRIYDQEPIVGFFKFPLWATLGGQASLSVARNNDNGYANALLWHFAFAWLLAGSFTIYCLYGLISRRFRRQWFPFTAKAVVEDAAKGRRSSRSRVPERRNGQHLHHTQHQQRHDGAASMPGAAVDAPSFR